MKSKNTNSALTATKKGKGFEVNRAIVSICALAFSRGPAIRVFSIFTDIVIILRISQPILEISNANIINQNIISPLLAF